VNFLRQGSRKLWFDRQTDRQTRLKLYTFAGGQTQLTHKQNHNIMTMKLPIDLYAIRDRMSVTINH